MGSPFFYDMRFMLHIYYQRITAMQNKESNLNTYLPGFGVILPDPFT
jgi:hypothetical protein